MRRIMMTSFLIMSVVLFGACTDNMEIDTDKVESAISLINAASQEDEASIALAHAAFDDLNEHEKKEVTNYTKLYFLSDYEISYIDLRITEPSCDSDLADFQPISTFHQISSIEELVEKFTFESIEEGGSTVFRDGELDKLNDGIFDNQFVVASAVPSNWDGVAYEENMEILLTQEGQIDLRFIKFDVTWVMEYRAFFIRIITFNTEQKLRLEYVRYYFFSPEESDVYREMTHQAMVDMDRRG
jgi:hypothetical protein